METLIKYFVVGNQCYATGVLSSFTKLTYNQEMHA